MEAAPDCTKAGARPMEAAPDRTKAGARPMGVGPGRIEVWVGLVSTRGRVRGYDSASRSYEGGMASSYDDGGSEAYEGGPGAYGGGAERYGGEAGPHGPEPGPHGREPGPYSRGAWQQGREPGPYGREAGPHGDGPGPYGGEPGPYVPGTPHRPPNPATNPYLRVPDELQGPEDARPGGEGGLRPVGENPAVKAAGRRLGRRAVGGHRAVRALGALRGMRVVGRNRGERGRERRAPGGPVVGRRPLRVRRGPVDTGGTRGRTRQAAALGHKTGPAVALDDRTGPAAGLRRTGRAAALGRRMRCSLPRRTLGRRTKRVSPTDRDRPTTSTAPPRWPARSTSPLVHRNDLPGSGRVAVGRPPETRAVSRRHRRLLPRRHHRRRRRGSRKGGADTAPVAGVRSGAGLCGETACFCPRGTVGDGCRPRPWRRRLRAERRRPCPLRQARRTEDVSRM